MSRRKLVRNSKLLLVKTTLAIITKGTTKVEGIQDSIVNVDQALTSDLILLNILRLLKTTKTLQLIITLMYLLFTEALIEGGDITTALDLTALPAIILTGIVIQNSILIVFINTLNFRNLFRIGFTIRTTIEGFVLVYREKIQKKLCFIKTYPRYNRLF